MTISINAQIIKGPWGGGNQVVKILVEYLRTRGYNVIHSLAGDIELILMIHPNSFLKIINYGIQEICDYMKVHPNTVLVHRINTSGDIHREEGIESDIIFESNKFADYTIFISSFLKDLYVNQKGFDINRPHSVILNGADGKIFDHNGRADWQPNQRLKIVTHHWSSNYMKGYDIYERLDHLLAVQSFKNMFEFTIIGNKPTGLKFKHTCIIPPLFGRKLSKILKQHHIYLTASRNEGAGMHHIEGMCCGLPVLYINSGALPEYCSPFGLEFSAIDFEDKLLEMREKYSELRMKVLQCPYIGTLMAAKYETLFRDLITDRKTNPRPGPEFLPVLKYHMYIKPSGRIRQLVNLVVRKARNHLMRYVKRK